jgi:group I intron endonuclease
MSKSYIYIIQNRINNKIYVGKSNNPKSRFYDHKKVALAGKQRYPEGFFAIHAAISKYGVENFSLEIIEEFSTEEEAYGAETFCIKFFNSNNKNYGYNCNLGGEGGISPNEEVLAKLVAFQNRPDVKLKQSDKTKSLARCSSNVYF